MDSDTGEFLTSEKKNVHVGFFVEWRISDAAIYYRANGGQEQSAVDRLSAIVNHGLRDEFGSRTLRQIVDDESHEVTTAIRTTAATQAAELGIELIDVRIRNVALPDNVRDAVYDRMRSERQHVAAETRAAGTEAADKVRSEADQQAQLVLADAYRDAEKVRAEGDARASEIYARAYGADPEFFRFYRSMNAYREVFRDRQDILVLEPKGEFFRYLHDPAARP
jgi:membrane protease subunit HflC